MLWVIDTVRIARSADVAYEIGSPFDRIAVAPDNSMVVAYFSAAGPDDAGLLPQPERARDHSPERAAERRRTRRCKTIRSFGSVPEGITLSPPMVVPGAADADAAHVRVRAVVEQPDAARRHASRRAARSRSASISAARPVMPREVVFAPHTASAYVRSDNARDVLQVLLEADRAARRTARTTSSRCSPSSAPAAARPTSRSTTIRAAAATCSRRRRTPARSS